MRTKNTRKQESMIKHSTVITVGHKYGRKDAVQEQVTEKNDAEEKSEERGH